LESLKGGDCSEDQSVDGKIILKSTLENKVGGCGCNLSGSR
jgi:hypothetical protein